jgi:hypothetical protein
MAGVDMGTRRGRSFRFERDGFHTMLCSSRRSREDAPTLPLYSCPLLSAHATMAFLGSDSMN